jgi:hypothetical protein
VAVLALTLIVLSVQGGSPPPSTTTTLLISPPTTTSTSAVSTTAAEPTTLTTSAEQRLAEVEDLLGDLWFGWFDAIYRKDPDALWQVVATTTFHEDGQAAMATMGFVAAPNRSDVLVEDMAVLLDRPDCLVVENSVDMTAFRDVRGGTTVTVLWSDARYGFRFATGWKFANDLWLNDCDNLIREVTP